MNPEQNNQGGPEGLKLRHNSIEEYTTEINKIMKQHEGLPEGAEKEILEMKMSNLRIERGKMIELKARAQQSVTETDTSGATIVRGEDHKSVRLDKSL